MPYEPQPEDRSEMSPSRSSRTSLMDLALQQALARAQAASVPQPPPASGLPASAVTPSFQGLGTNYPDYDPVRRTYSPGLQTPPSGWQFQYAKPGPYVIPLNPQQEARFQQWVRQNNVPFDPSPTSDYDMRGFWLAAQQGDPRAVPR